jgi:hypothetical protein
MKFTIGAVGSTSSYAKNNIGVVYVNSFSEDNYHSFMIDDESEPGIESKIDKIKHINKDPETYHNSLIIYNEYMELLTEKYGGDQLFRIAFKNGLVTEKIPPRPEFKVTKKNRDIWNIIKSGGAISKVNSLSMSEESERDYLQRSNVDDWMDEVTIEPGEHSEELRRTIKETKPQMGIDYDDYDDDETISVKYVDTRSLNNVLNMRYGNDDNDSELDFEVTLTDIWTDSDRYKRKLAREAEDEMKNVHVNAKWKRCTTSEATLVTSLESAGWDSERLADKIDGTILNDRKKSSKFAKKSKKKKDKRDKKYAQFEIKTFDDDDEPDDEKHTSDVLAAFAEFTNAYFDFSSDNILIN